MRTTLILNDDTYREAKAAAARMGVSVGSVVETALREHLARLAEPATRLTPLPTFVGSPRAGIVFDRTSALLDALDLEDLRRAQR